LTTLWSSEAHRRYQSIGGSNPSGPIPNLSLSEREVNPEPKICEFCGFYITEYLQDCAPLDDGVCQA